MSRHDEFHHSMPEEGLNDHERAILDFAGKQYSRRGVQEEDINKTFGYRATTYFARLNHLLDNPHAMAYAPRTVKQHQGIVDAGLQRAGRRPKYSAPTDQGDTP